jgi:hypothetical protein
MNKSSYVHINNHTFRRVLMGRKNVCACHVDAPPEKAGLKKIVMVGNPNVGKRVIKGLREQD